MSNSNFSKKSNSTKKKKDFQTEIFDHKFLMPLTKIKNVETYKKKC